MVKKTSISLLTFCRDDYRILFENLSPVFQAVNEVIVIDSSNRDNYLSLMKELDKFNNTKVFHVIPTGYPDPLRMYGMSKCTSDYIIYLDTDERLSTGYISYLNQFREYCHGYAGYETIRFEYGEAQSKEKVPITWQTRLFRRDSLSSGIIHETIQTFGKIARLGVECGIIHFGRRWGKNYYLLESMLKPPTVGKWASHFLSLIKGRRIYTKLGENVESPMSFTIFLTSLERIISPFMYRTFTMGMVYQIKNDLLYDKECILAFYKLDRRTRNKFIEISLDIQESGGIIKYLNFDDFEYVEKLSAEYEWDISGFNLLIGMLFYRFTHGKTISSIKDLGVCDLHQLGLHTVWP